MFTTSVPHNSAASAKIGKTYGLSEDEKHAVLLFCLTDDYPRELILERTGTRYYLKGVRAAHQLYKNLRGIHRTTLFSKDERGHVAEWSNELRRYTNTPDIYTPRETNSPPFSPFKNMTPFKGRR